MSKLNLNAVAGKLKQNPKKWQRKSQVIFVLVFAVVGTALVLASHAATAYGPIVGDGGYCLDDWGAGADDGNLIDLYWCNGTKAQQWSYNSSTGSITNVNGWCLDDYGNGQTPESKVDLWWCNGSAAQKWVVNATAGTIMHGNLCLDNQWGVVTPKNPIWLYSCNGTAAQDWKVTTIAPQPTPTPAPTPAPTPTVSPTITSAKSATFTEGTAGSFTVTDTGSPAPSLTESGTLPSGITFNTSNGVLSGTPGTSGTYTLTFTASNGVSPNAVQSFSLTVNAPPSTGGSGGSGSSAGGGTGTVASLFPDSIFNKNVTGYPVDSNSGTYVNELVSQATPALSANDPIYVVPAGTPEASVTCGGCSGAGEVPVPSGYNPSSGSDKPIFIVSQSLNKIWEFWLFQPSGSGYTSSWGGGATLSTFTGAFPSPYGESATGISYAATAITTSDVSQGAIDHAMAVAIGECSGQVYPATRNDCGGGGPPEGQMFRFSSSVNCNSFSGLAQMVCNGGKNYGFVIVDKTGGPWVDVSAQSGVSGSLSGLPWSQLQAIDPPN